MNKPLSIFILLLLVISVKSNNLNLPFNSELVENRKIAFNESFSYHLDDNTSWKIVDSENFSILNSGIGSIVNVVFSTPGNFEIEISEVIDASNAECQHGNFPSKIMLEVTSTKMVFDFSTIKFSNELVGGQSQSGNEISIDVYFESYNKQNILFDGGNITSAGVGVNIDGTYKSEGTPLKQGVNHVVYSLKGQAKSNTYIMFDFYDINNQIISYTYPTLIK